MLRIDGLVSVYRLPPGQWMRGTVRAMPVQGAIFMTSYAIRAGADGGYLVRDVQVQRIVKGYINNFAVSPDGCTVAMYIQPADGVVSRLAMINVCKGE